MALLALAALVYSRAWRGQFLWDDDANIINNTPLRSLGGLWRIWFVPGATQQYYPLTHTSFWIEYHLWGLHPAGYHITNILLHAGNAILLWIILCRLSVPGAWLGAVLFAVHPVAVESVAWITERKNVLSGVFFLGSLLASLKYWLPELWCRPTPPPNATPGRRICGPRKFYWLAIGLYVCALWSKTAAIGLPAVVLLLVWWKRRRLEWRDVLAALPFGLPAILLGLVTLWVEKHELGATGSAWDFSPGQRLVLAGRAAWFYLGKLAWPHPLMFMYPRWNLAADSLLEWAPLASALAGLAFLCWKRKSWGRPVLAAVGFFLIMLFPVLGLFNVYFFRFAFVCDHFQYLACMGPLALAAGGLTLAFGRYRHRITLVIPALAVLGLAVVSWRQTAVYKDRLALWRDTLFHNPQSAMAHNNLGFLLLAAGQTAEASDEFNSALKIEPNNANARNSLGAIFLQENRVPEAIEQFRRALEVSAGYSAAHVNLANALLQAGRLSEAIAEYQIALGLTPDDMAAHVNLADALFMEGRDAEAASQYAAAIKLAAAAGRKDVVDYLTDELKKRQSTIERKPGQ